MTTTYRTGPANLGPEDHAVHWTVAGSFGVSTEVHGSRAAAVERAGALMSAGSHVTLLGINRNVPALTQWADCR